jgi:hypothetical protein
MILVLQQLYNLADDALEYQLLDRLAQAGLGTQLFDAVQ